jgi:Fe-S cluster assembly iron-binding protein IscA
MNGETETRTGLRVSIGEGNTLGLKSSTSSDSELVAGDVVLSTTGSTSSVQSDSLSSQQVVAWCDVGGDLEVELSA